jgi:hypothetical protein
MNWYKITIDRDGIIKKKGLELYKEFQRLLIVLDAPQELSLFTLMNRSSESELFYIAIPEDFRPFPDLLLKKYGAILCDEPNLLDLRLVLGAKR